MVRIGGLRRDCEERCLRHRKLDGHTTPKWVLQKRRAALPVNVLTRRELAKYERWRQVSGAPR
jgi:hypothetical protein